MAISEFEAEQLANLLPFGLRCDNSRQRLLAVTEILRLLTDERHPLSNADIRAIIGARFGKPAVPAENTLNDDLRAIHDSGALGQRMYITSLGSCSESKELTPANVRLLLNAAQASPFLTEGEENELQESLEKLVSVHQAANMLGEVYVDQRVPRSYAGVFSACDAISQAIAQDRKIEFVYTYTGFDGQPHPLTGDNGDPLRVETPIALLFSENNYYVETWADKPWRHGIHLMRSRVDRMMNVCVSEEDADHGREVYNARRGIRKRMREGFEMVDGKSRRIFLRVRADRTNVMFDRFGYDLRFGPVKGEPGAPDSTALTLVTVAESFTFFRWLSAAGDGIVMAPPPRGSALHSGPWARKLKGTAYGELKADYEAMVSAYLAYLDRARAPYE